MSNGIPAIERPNGKLYRPRKIQTITIGNECSSPTRPRAVHASASALRKSR